MKFQVTIVGHGAEALEFLNDSDNSFFILFNENAPEELARFLCYIQFLQFIKNRHLVIP